MTNDKPILLLLGAGASYGSGGMIDPPPISENLLDKLCTKYPTTWGKITIEDRKKFEDEFNKTKNFENGMEWLYSVEGQKKT